MQNLKLVQAESPTDRAFSFTQREKETYRPNCWPIRLHRLALLFRHNERFFTDDCLSTK